MTAPRKEQLAEGVTLWQADCRDLLASIGRFDLLLTDPPFGIGQHGGRGHRKRSRAKVQEKLDWDNERPELGVFKAMLSTAPHHIIWGGNYFADCLPIRSGWLYWQKLIGGDFSDGELAWTSRTGALHEFTYRKTNAEMEHPTQKPVALLTWCLDLFPQCESVLDPFAGVASTGVAAINRGVSFTGIEREPKYFDIACRRLSEAIRMPRLPFEESRKVIQEEMPI